MRCSKHNLNTQDNPVSQHHFRFNTFCFVFSSVLASSLLATARADDSTGKKEVIDLGTTTVVGQLDSYFEDTQSTVMKGDYADKDTPYSVSTVNDALIEDLRAERLEDTYNYATGVTRSGYLADSLVVRGYDIDLNNIKVNGMSGLISRFGSPSTANVERMEIVKGPASVLYGNMETGGMVNIQTKQPKAKQQTTLQVSSQSYMTDVSEIGDDNGVTLTFDTTGPLASNVFYRFIATGEKIDSFRDNISFENYFIYPSLLWEISPNSSLLVGLEVGKEEGSADHGLFAAQQDIKTVAPINTVYQEKNDYDNDEGVAFDLDFNHQFDDSLSYNFKWRGVWHEDERKLYESIKVNNVDLAAGKSIADTTLQRRNRHQLNKRDWHSFDTSLTKNMMTGSVEHDVTVGISSEYRLTDFKRISQGKKNTVEPNISIYNPVLGGTAASNAGNHRKTEYLSSAVYFQDRVQLTDVFTLVGAGRINYTRIDFTCISGKCADDNRTGSTDLVGSLGALYKFTDKLSTYASYGQSFDPHTAERVDKTGAALKPEESEQVEVGLKYGVNDQLNFGISAYQIDKKNVSNSLGGGVYETLDAAESEGVDIDLQWLPFKHWQIKAGYAYNETEVSEGDNKGEALAHSPENSGYLFTRYNFPQQIMGGEVGLSAGLMFRDEVKTDVSVKNSVTLPDYTLLDLGAYYERGTWQWALNLENVTDKTYYDAGSDDERIYVGDPRKLTLTMTKAF